MQESEAHKLEKLFLPPLPVAERVGVEPTIDFHRFYQLGFVSFFCEGAPLIPACNHTNFNSKSKEKIGIIPVKTTWLFSPDFILKSEPISSHKLLLVAQLSHR